MISSHGATHQGRVRAHNEDSLVVDAEAGFFAVCDGMGGHVGGEIASSIAAETVIAFIRDRNDDDWPFGRESGLEEGADLLRNATFLANQRITERIDAEPWLARMGTTMVSALVRPGGRAYLANVGDSRAYLWRQGRLRQLTSDHSWVNEQVLQGVLTPEEAGKHPLKNVITRALGAKTLAGVDLLEEQLQADDILLLCSDGLTTMVSDADIDGLFREGASRPETLCEALVEAANLAGGEDNITVALIAATAAVD